MRGLTLVEMMISIAVLTILATVGVPSFRSTLHNHRVALLANEFNLALTLARGEAIRRGTDAWLCASSDGATCAGDWTDGWLLQAAPPNAPPTAPIRVWPSSLPRLGPHPDGELAAVRFDGLGAAHSPARFVIGRTDDRRLRARVLTVERVGRVELKPYCADRG